MDRKKELKEQYKNMKPDMGILMVKNEKNNKCYVEGTQNLKAKLNRIRFSLEFGSFPVRDLQEEWKAYGEQSFTFQVLEQLEYDKDETRTDYSDDLAILELIWKERLAGQGMAIYKG